MKKGRYSKFLVILIIVLNIIFTGADFYVIVKTGIEPVALTSAWFGFTTVELWTLATIKKNKAKEKKDEEIN